MSESLRDQLLKSGLVKQTRKPKPSQGKKGGKPRRGGRHGGKADQPGEVDLARAYAMRAKAEAHERRQAKAEAEAEARERKERKRRLQKLLDGNRLNKPDAEHARHFEYGGKIRRVYVDEAQLDQLNAGKLGVVQLSGSYLLVAPDIVRQVREFAPDHVALMVDPEAPPPDDGVPDDLVW